MGKKYLDTKQSTIEAAVLDVWADSAEEQSAIRSAARMVVDDTMGEGAMPETAKQRERRLERKAQVAADKLAAKVGTLNPKYPSLGQRLSMKGRGEPIPPKYILDPTEMATSGYAGKPPTVATVSKPKTASGSSTVRTEPAPAPKASDYPKIGVEEPPRKKAAAKTQDPMRYQGAGPGELSQKHRAPEPKKAEKPKKVEKPKKAEKAKPWVDPDTQVQKGHPDYKQNPDKTYGPRHKRSRGKYAGSDDPRFSSDPSSGGTQNVDQYAHYQHELAVQEAIQNAANRMISEMERDDPGDDVRYAFGDKRRGGARAAMQKQRDREKEQKELQRQAKGGKGVNVPADLTKQAQKGEQGSRRVDAVSMQSRATAGEGGRPADSQSVKPKTKPMPPQLDRSGRMGAPKPRKQDPMRYQGAGPGELSQKDRKPATTPTKVAPTKVVKKLTKPKVPAGISKVKIAPDSKKAARYAANVRGSRLSDPGTGNQDQYAQYQPENGDYIQEVTGDKEEYTKFFNAAMKKFGVTSPDQLKGDKRKEFYDYVDAGWEGDNEKAEQVVRDFKVNSMREALRQMWSQQNEEGDVGQRHPGSKPGVWKRSPGAMGGKADTKTGPKVKIDLKPKTGNPHY